MQRISPLILALLLLGLGACQPEIGDACKNAAECGERQVCDISVPGANGYCTIFDCREGDCPGSSVCVDFGERSACMAKCSSNRDCRRDDGFVCRDDVGEAKFCYQPATEPIEPPRDVDLQPAEDSADDISDASDDDASSDDASIDDSMSGDATDDAVEDTGDGDEPDSSDDSGE